MPDDESKQAEIPGYAEQRRAEFHEIGRQAFADGAIEQNAKRRAAGLQEPELTRERALQIADGWLDSMNTVSSNSNTRRSKSDLILATQAPSDYDDSDITLGKQRAAQLDRLNKQESDRRKDINMREVFDDNF